MKQKLALICTLVHRPKVLILDEPTTGVDPVSRREFWKLLSEFSARGLTIVMATPYLDEAERCTRVALLHEGRLLALDAPAVLQSEMAGVMLEVAAGVRRPPIDALASLPGVVGAHAFGDRAHVRISGDVAGVSAAIAAALEGQGLAAPSIRRVTPSLEDVFIDLIGRRPRPSLGSQPS
jgi:ABC-2 type transport system ATP-binding protein